MIVTVNGYKQDKQVDILISKNQMLKIVYLKHHETYITPTLITKALRLVTSSSTATFNACYSDLMPYTVLANSYGFSIYDAYQCQGHIH